MSNIPCTFTISSGQAGGKLSGGFPKQGGGFYPPLSGPQLEKDDTLTVSVEHPDAASAPQKLTGIFVFSAGPTVPRQPKASPFVDEHGHVRCLQRLTADKSVANGKTLYTFAPFTYRGGSDGHYELTFVAENSAAIPPIQWAEDPEFDTGN